MISATLSFVVRPVALEALLHLGRQLAGRLEDEGAGHPRPGAARLQKRQHRQRERRRLAGAGLGDAQDVPPGKHMGNGFGLDRRRLGVTGRGDGLQTFSLSPRSEKRHFVSATVARPAGAKDIVAATIRD